MVKTCTITAALSAVICFAACSSKSSEKKSAVSQQWEQHRLQKYNQAFAQLAATVQNGYLITRLGSDITSEMFRQLNETDKSFSHCGIASIENDTIFVYHAIGGEFNPNQKLKRETLYSFGHPLSNKSLGIFKPKINAAQTIQVINFSQESFLAGIPFDMKFNYETDDKFYCAEFVAKAYCKALNGNSNWFHFYERNNLKYLAVDNLTKTIFFKEIKRSMY